MIGNFILWGLLALFLIWVLPPSLMILTRSAVPWSVRLWAVASGLRAWVFGGWVKVFAALTAWFMVPLLLRDSRWEDEQLVRLNGIYGNNWGINGDDREWLPITEAASRWTDVDPHYDTAGLPRVDGEGVPLLVTLDRPGPEAYYMPGRHCRERVAREAWLKRNRCTNLAIRMGDEWPDAEDSATSVKQVWGDMWCGRGKPGWALFEHGGLFQFICALRVPFTTNLLVMNWGWALGLTRDRAMSRCPAELLPFAFKSPHWPPDPEVVWRNLSPSKRAEILEIQQIGETK